MTTVPKNEEHENTAFIDETVAHLEADGWTSERKMEEDGLHIYLTGPGATKPCMEFSEL